MRRPPRLTETWSSPASRPLNYIITITYAINLFSLGLSLSRDLLGPRSKQTDEAAGRGADWPIIRVSLPAVV